MKPRLLLKFNSIRAQAWEIGAVSTTRRNVFCGPLSFPMNDAQLVGRPFSVLKEF